MLSLAVCDVNSPAAGVFLKSTPRICGTGVLGDLQTRLPLLFFGSRPRQSGQLSYWSKCNLVCRSVFASAPLQSMQQSYRRKCKLVYRPGFLRCRGDASQRFPFAAAWVDRSGRLLAEGFRQAGGSESPSAKYYRRLLADRPLTEHAALPVGS